MLTGQTSSHALHDVHAQISSGVMRSNSDADVMVMSGTVPIGGVDDLSKAYTPGVARVCEAIATEPGLVQDYTWVSNTVAVVTDGTAVLGLGDIGPTAAMPVM